MVITKVIKQGRFTYEMHTNVNKVIYKWNILTEILVSPTSLRTLYLYEFYLNIIMLNKKKRSFGERLRLVKSLIYSLIISEI